MRKKAVQQGRSERRGESYSVPYVEPLSDARTPLAGFFRILLDRSGRLVRACGQAEVQGRANVSALELGGFCLLIQFCFFTTAFPLAAATP